MTSPDTVPQPAPRAGEARPRVLPSLRRRDLRVLAAHADGKPFRITSEREGWAVGTLHSRGFLEHSVGANYRITPAGRATLAPTAAVAHADGGRSDA